MECALWHYAYGKPKGTVQVDLPATWAQMSTADLKKHSWPRWRSFDDAPL